mmetsp:Transcript_123297/g.348405  ORF Transcript_123297/g.348405 Transcript_123297/m.348405 type:complete len:209 (-) Transcript_123297:503-1129(-)
MGLCPRACVRHARGRPTPGLHRERRGVVHEQSLGPLEGCFTAVRGTPDPGPQEHVGYAQLRFGVMRGRRDARLGALPRAAGSNGGPRPPARLWQPRRRGLGPGRLWPLGIRCRCAALARYVLARDRRPRLRLGSFGFWTRFAMGACARGGLFGKRPLRRDDRRHERRGDGRCREGWSVDRGVARVVTSRSPRETAQRRAAADRAVPGT